MLGTIVMVAEPLLGAWWAVGGGAAMVGAMALQGRTHRLEATAPVPFRGPLDIVTRILAEEWITFPRFVLNGEFGRAWHSHRSIRG
jgi:hypothetical protein